MMGKMGLLGTLVFLGILLVIFSAVTHTADSATYETGSTTMNVTIRGWVGINVSNCITNGITFLSQDQATSDNNASCNNNTGGGTGYNLTRDSSSTVNINFSHASNRSNLTTGTFEMGIDNVTYNSNYTSNTAGDLYDEASSSALSTSWIGMEDCDGINATDPDCWAMYYLDVPGTQDPGTYTTGYCWCGRQTATAEDNCGTCT